MFCPSCRNKARVIQTNAREDDVVRRYRCVCGVRFTGLERILSNSIAQGGQGSPAPTGAVPRSEKQQQHAKKLNALSRKK